MRGMCAGARAARVFALAASLSACAAATPASAPRSPPPVAAAPADVPPAISANAGATFVFHATAAGAPSGTAALPEIEALRPALKELLHVDIGAGGDLARLGADPARPILLSWAIVDPGQLLALRKASPPPPRDAPLIVRAVLVIPLADAAGLQGRLAALPPDERCARPRDDEARWAALRARLATPEDRRAGEDRSAAYVCHGDRIASIMRLDLPRRQLTWTLAFGDGSLLAAASRPPAIDVALAVRLQRRGFFAARAGMYTTPADEARAYVALGMVKTRHAIDSAPREDLRGELWREYLWEVGGHDRLVDSEPRLFSELLLTDGQVSWTLTPEGRTFFASLGLAAGMPATDLGLAVEKRLKPVGPFADRKKLVATVQEAGSGAFMLIKHFLWPHVLAFAASNPDDLPTSIPVWADEGARVELDRDGRVLSVRAGAPE